VHPSEKGEAVRQWFGLNAAGDGQKAVDRVVVTKLSAGYGRPLNRLERPPRQVLGGMGLCRAARLLIQTEHHDQQRQQLAQRPSARD